MWRIIRGSPDFFSITKKMHNALQGGEARLTEQKEEIYENVIYQNTSRNHLDREMLKDKQLRSKSLAVEPPGREMLLQVRSENQDAAVSTVGKKYAKAEGHHIEAAVQSLRGAPVRKNGDKKESALTVKH